MNAGSVCPIRWGMSHLLWRTQVDWWISHDLVDPIDLDAGSVFHNVGEVPADEDGDVMDDGGCNMQGIGQISRWDNLLSDVPFGKPPRFLSDRQELHIVFFDRPLKSRSLLDAGCSLNLSRHKIRSIQGHHARVKPSKECLCRGMDVRGLAGIQPIEHRGIHIQTHPLATPRPHVFLAYHVCAPRSKQGRLIDRMEGHTHA